MAQEPQLRLFGDDNEEPIPDRYPTPPFTRSVDSPILTSVEIDGLKGFDHVTIELQPFTILTGPNNSGKSTILQAIALGFECFRRCLDTDHWQLRTTGRAIAGFEFLPVNQPKDLWYKQIWKRSRNSERYVRVGLSYSNGFSCSVRIRFLYGVLNVGLETESVARRRPSTDLLKAIYNATPVLLPASPGPVAHEDYLSLAQIHRLLTLREPNRALRNILLLLQQDSHKEERDYVSKVLLKYFGVRLVDIEFEQDSDLEIRAPYKEAEDYTLDVISAGSGLNQILLLAATIAWRKPG